MWRTIVFAIVYICLVFPPDAQGSCLEYGHSCWGAHGKRSSGSAIGGKKAPRDSVSRNLRDNEWNGLGEDNVNQIAANKFDLDEAFSLAESSPHQSLSAEDFSTDSNDSTKPKTRGYTRLRHLKFPTQISQSVDNNQQSLIDINNRESNGDSREEQQQQQQQQPKYPKYVERWRRLPLFGQRHTFGNSPLALNDAAPLQLPARNAENDLLQQIGHLPGAGRLDDIGVYYDFP